MKNIFDGDYQCEGQLTLEEVLEEMMNNNKKNSDEETSNECKKDAIDLQ